MANKHEGNQILQNDEKYVWHGMKPYNPQGTMVIESSEGAKITDHEGNEYIDAMAGLWCVNAGYGRKELAQAAYDEMVKNPYVSLTQAHPTSIKLAEKISELLEDDYVIFFSNSGSEANEVAFKIARQYYAQQGKSSKYKVVSRYRAYHGNTMGALAATGQAERKIKYEPLAPGFMHVAPPDMYRTPEATVEDPTTLASVQAVDNLMTWEMGETIATMIMEPLISGGGILLPPNQYLQGIKSVCEKHDVLLIVDEVICGFGRTGKPFAHQHYGVKPDIVTMAKGITSGYLPLSATAVKREIYESFKGTELYDYFRHVNTFGGSPAACAVALANIEILENEGLWQRSAEKGAEVVRQLKDRLASHPLVGDIRGKGLLIGIEMVKDKETKEPVAVDVLNQIIGRCKNLGVIIGKNGATVAGYNNVLAISPPLNCSDKELQIIIDTLDHVIWERK